MTTSVASRLGVEEAAELYRTCSLPELGELANARKQELHPAPVITYVIDRNINYTNICITGCTFCAFYRRPGHAEGYVIPNGKIYQKIQETVELGGSGILIQGGLNPDLKLDYYVELFEGIMKRFPALHIHGLSPEEIFFIARISKLPIGAVLERLKAAGMRTIPGGGAEILTPRWRKELHRTQCTIEGWLEVMRTAHGLGMRSSCSQVIGFGESVEDRLEHLKLLRDLQDETGGFTAFITWTYQPENTDRGGELTPPGEYLKHLALCRLFLDNISNIQSSWPTQGEKVGQLALFFGANDMGSIMIEENVVAAAGTIHTTTQKRIRELIKDAGFVPKKRNHLYQIVQV